MLVRANDLAIEDGGARYACGDGGAQFVESLECVAMAGYQSAFPGLDVRERAPAVVVWSRNPNPLKPRDGTPAEEAIDLT